ncbi:MAG TPA: glycosyltransferase family 9 protein [Terriglobales bacterium]|nr:glycosyltransferase family 9 protein [Terriglobales bacterium]
MTTRLAILRLRSLGDTLLMTPTLDALKRWRPQVQIAVAVEPRFRPVLAANPAVDQIIEVPNGAGGRLRALAELRAFKPGTVAGLHGGSTAAWLARLSGAPVRVTFDGLRHRWAYNQFTPPEAPPSGRAKLHTVEHVASLFHELGMPRDELGPLRLFPRAEARAAVRKRLAQRGIAGAYAFLNTEAREAGMRWPMESFQALAARLLRERGLACVACSAGPGIPVPGVTLVGGTSVEELIALEAEAALVIGNDGGPIHIAAALAKPIVALYSSTDVPVWSPWQAPAKILQANPIGTITVDQVLGAAAPKG